MVQQVRMRTSWLNENTGEHGRDCMNGTTGGCIEQQVWGGRCQSINLRKRCGCIEARVADSMRRNNWSFSF
jgi:hypothetical protein